MVFFTSIAFICLAISEILPLISHFISNTKINGILHFIVIVTSCIAKKSETVSSLGNELDEFTGTSPQEKKDTRITCP